MSHITILKEIDFKDTAAIHAAAAELKLNVGRNLSPRMFYQDQHVKCPVVIKLPSNYDVGFIQNNEGFTVAVFDDYAQNVSKYLGAGGNPIGRFSQSYTKFAIINAALAAGYTISSVDIDKEGNVLLEINND